MPRTDRQPPSKRAEPKLAQIREHEPRALGDRHGASALGLTIAPPRDDAIPHKWGCDAEAGKLARPLIPPHID